MALLALAARRELHRALLAVDYALAVVRLVGAGLRLADQTLVAVLGCRLDRMRFFGLRLLRGLQGLEALHLGEGYVTVFADAARRELHRARLAIDLTIAAVRMVLHLPDLTDLAEAIRIRGLTLVQC